MESSSVLPVYDHVIFESGSIVGVDKEGTRHPISREDWEKTHPEHRNTQCGECTFVQDQETLLTFFVPRDKRELAGIRPEFVGKFTMPGWTGHSGFYLFKCVDCDNVGVDYPHGYCDGGHIYIQCDKCRCRIVFYPDKHRDVYKSEGVVPPPTFRAMIKGILTLRLRTVFRGSSDDWQALQRPLRIEDQKKLKISGRIPTDLES